jgi:hypothetical protein
MRGQCKHQTDRKNEQKYVHDRKVSRTNGTFRFARHPDSYRDRPFANPKEPFFANAPLKDFSLYYKS